MVHSFSQEEVLDLDTLWRGHRAIAMEGFSESFASFGVVKALRANFDHSRNLIKSFFKNRDVSVYPKINDVYLKVFSDLDFADIVQLRAYIPAGMSVQMHAYTVALASCIDVHFPSIIATISKLNIVCSKALNNKEFRRGVGFSKEIPAKNPDAELDMLRKLFTRGGVTQTSVGKAYDNEDDVAEVFRTLETSRQIAMNTNPRDVRKAIDDFIVVAEALTKALEADYQEGSISNTVIRDISEAIFMVARQAEFYGFLVNGLAEAITAWNDTWVAVNKAA